MDLEADGLISVYDIETSNVVAALEGLDVYFAIKNAIFVLDEVQPMINNIHISQKLFAASEYLKEILHETRQ